MLRSRTLTTTTAGLLALVTFVALALNWRLLATHYHLWELRQDSAHLKEALVAPEESSVRAAAENFLVGEEGKRAFVRVYEAVITEALEDGALDFRTSLGAWTAQNGPLPAGLQTTHRAVFGVLKEIVDFVGFSGDEVFLESKVMKTKTSLLIALQHRARELYGFACETTDSRCRLLCVGELGAEFAPFPLGDSEEVVLYLERAGD